MRMLLVQTLGSVEMANFLPDVLLILNDAECRSIGTAVFNDVLKSSSVVPLLCHASCTGTLSAIHRCRWHPERKQGFDFRSPGIPDCENS